MNLHFANIFEAMSDAIPESSCMVQGTRSVSWREFDDAASRLAAALFAAGVRPNDKVGVYLYNCPEWMVTFYATLKIRAVPVTINYRYIDQELGYLLDDCEASAVVYHSGFAERMEKVASTRRDRLRLLIQVDDGSGYSAVESHITYDSILRDFPRREREQRDPTDSVLIYTGGTTGLPKGVALQVGMTAGGMLMGPLAERALGLDRPPGLQFIDFALELHRRGEKRVACPVAPLMHAAGLTLGAIPALCTGGTIVFLPRPSFEPATLATSIGTHGITTMVIVGDAMARPLIHHLEEARAQGIHYDFSSLRVIVTSGVALTTDAQRGLFEFMPDVTILDQAGSTEGGLGHRRLTKSNYLLNPGFTTFPGVRVLRPDDTDVEPGTGERGLLACPTVAAGYYRDAKKTAEVFREIDGKKYVLAGDWATMEHDGTVVLIGRGSSVINTGGEKVFAEEVEGIVCTIPGVVDCLVVGTPDERFGQTVTAVVSVRDKGLTGEDIAAGVRQQLAGYKIPRRIVFVPEVPRSPTGKPDRAQAVRLAKEQLSGNQSASSQSRPQDLQSETRAGIRGARGSAA